MKFIKTVSNIQLLLFYTILFFTNQISAQVQWANTVIDVSSYYKTGNKTQYLPIQVLGKPNKLPDVGTSGVAWSPEFEDNLKDFIRVNYKKADFIQQVAVGESFNPGSIITIHLYDSLGTEHLIYENLDPKPITGSIGRVFNVFFEMTTYKVKDVKITLNPKSVPGFNHIDAIGISNLKDSIKALINAIPYSEEVLPKENLGSSINSLTDELLPVISPNGKTLYFTRQGHQENIGIIANQDIYSAEIKEDGTFSNAKNIGAPLNNSENSAATSITPDGQRMMVLNIYNENGTMEKGVSISDFNGTNWGFPKKVLIDSFYNDNIYGEYFLSNSGQYLVMTLERNNSEGLKDIYVSFIKEDFTWSAPKHLGALINTAESEASPFLSADDKTLYFSSKGHSGYGSNDMYKTQRLDDSWTNWSEPENLGNKINTKGWDAYFSFPASGEFAYYVSYTNSLGAADIFRQKLPKSAKPKPVALVIGTVLNAKTKLPMRSKVTYKNLTTGKIIGSGISDSLTGKFEIVLPSGSKYSILAEKNEYYSVNEAIDLTKLDEYKEIKKDIYLVPIEVGEIARLNNIFFDFNKAELKSESFVELNQLVKLMIAKTNMQIQINGHTDDVGEVPTNITLSLKRAKAVSDYLIEKGVLVSRITYKGFGESSPIKKGITDEIRQLNRRVEFLIIKK